MFLLGMFFDVKKGGREEKIYSYICIFYYKGIKPR